MVAANAAILVFSIYFAESFYLERVHFGLIGILGLVAGIAAISIFIQSISPIKEAEMRVFGKVLSKDTYPAIWHFVESLAKTIGTEAPNTIIAGMDPTFFVTESKVLCLDGQIQGRTLYLSLPFCRSFTKREFAAIIGHEMGHFIGNDTRWSKRFYPIYRGATNTVLSLDNPDNKDGLAQFAFLPSLIFMNIFITAFMTSEKAISRQRELNADSVGMNLTSKEDMGTALVKAHIYQHVWIHTQQKMKEHLANGKQITNLSAYFSSICEAIPQDFMKYEIEQTHTAHPTDTHPPLSVRLNSMGIKRDEVYERGIVNINDDPAINLIDEAETLEKELSDLEYYKLGVAGKTNSV